MPGHLSQGRNFDPSYTFATFAAPNGTFYMSLKSPYPSTYSIDLRVMPDPSNNVADCNPIVTPQSGTVGTQKQALFVSYNCGTSIGRVRIFMGFSLNGTCESNIVWCVASSIPVVCMSIMWGYWPQEQVFRHRVGCCYESCSVGHHTRRSQPRGHHQPVATTNGRVQLIDEHARGVLHYHQLPIRAHG